MFKKKNIIGICVTAFLILSTTCIIPVSAAPEIKNISKIKKIDQKLKEINDDIINSCSINQKGFCLLELFVSFWIVCFQLMGLTGLVPIAIYYLLPRCDNDELLDLIEFWILIL